MALDSQESSFSRSARRNSGPDRPIRDLVVDDPGEGRFKVHRDVYVDEEIYELEMNALFESTWQFLALEQEVSEPGDYVVRRIGRQSVIVTRDEEGEVHALINVCAHRGAKICRSESGNSSRFRCFYHGWTYDNRGEIRGVPDREGYPDSFDFSEISLERVPRVVNYRGMIFGCLDPEVEDFEAFMGPATPFIDAHWARWPEGVELIGHHKVQYDGNWKLRHENMMDNYHVPVLHNTWRGQMSIQVFKSMVSMDLGRGHGGFLITDPEAFESFSGLGYDGTSIAGTITEEQRRDLDPMVNNLVDLGGHVGLFPNFWLSQHGIQLRFLEPVDVDETITHMLLFLPKSMPEEERARFKQDGEDFWGPSGDATPDDAEVFASVQLASDERTELEWLDLSRGINRSHDSFEFASYPPDREQPEIVEASPSTDDTGIRGFYRYWAEYLDDWRKTGSP